jgi:SAM-dependent methyltransferase
MTNERIKPISVKPPSANYFLFMLRCLVDFQLATIVRWLKPAILNLHNGNILDIGAGESPWREWLPEGCTYFGIDVEISDKFGMHIRHEDVTFFDGETIPFADAAFDGAICIEVLEHAVNPERLVMEAARVLKKDAPFIVTTPFSARRHHIPYDYRRFTKEGLFRLLAENGFKHIAIQERGGDIVVIANKLLIVTLRNMKELTKKNFFYTIPCIFFFGLISFVFIPIAHISIFLGGSGKEDPLGYFCIAFK